MNILLDTPAMIRWMEDRVTRRLVRMMGKPHTVIAVSILTPWEIALEPKLGFQPADVTEAVAKMGGGCCPCSRSHIEQLAEASVARRIIVIRSTGC